jgi:prophage tail gpP-like protein
MQEDKQIASYPVDIQLGQTVFELIQEYARIGQVLVYDDADGNLVASDAELLRFRLSGDLDGYRSVG